MTDDIRVLISRARTYVEIQAEHPDTPMRATGLATEMADALEGIRAALAHHLDAARDPCQDRGVDWPCDVADALAASARTGADDRSGDGGSDAGQSG